MNAKLLLVCVFMCLPLVCPAPVEKRSKEIILFGNRQNKPRDSFAAKKSVDVAADTPEYHATSTSEDHASPNKETVAVPGKPAVPEAESNDPTPVVGDDVSTVNRDTHPEIGVADSKKPQAAPDTVVEPEEATEHQKEGSEPHTGIEGVPDPYLQELYEYISNYKTQPLSPSVPSRETGLGSYPGLYSLRRKRTALSTHRIPKPLKRARRIKRDLLDDAEYYPKEYTEQEKLPSDEELYDMFHSTAQNLQDLADLLDLYTEHQTPLAPATPYDTMYEGYQPRYEDAVQEADYYTPVKRQLLSTLPGLRKRSFFPSYDEPETHWGPFIPQRKRDYGRREENYEVLSLLAQALAAEDESSPYYYEPAVVKK